MINRTLLNSKRVNLPYRNYITFFAIAVVGVFASCEKRTFESTPATVLLFNALDDGTNLIVNMNETGYMRYNMALQLRNRSFNQESFVHVNSSPQPIAFYANYDTLPKDAPALNVNLDVKDGELYSMFIYGERAAAEYLLNKDRIPSNNLTDSVTYIRFVNLSANQDVAINLKGTATGSFISRLSFKQVSEFIPLKIDQFTSSYEFEVRDLITDNVLSSYIAKDINKFTSISNQWYNRSNTLVFAGKKDGSGNNVQALHLMPNRF